MCVSASILQVCDEILPVIHLSVRFVSSFWLSAFSVLHSSMFNSHGKFMSTFSFLADTLMFVSCFDFIEVDEKRSMGKDFLY